MVCIITVDISDCHLKTKTKATISISKPSTFYCFVYAELCCLSAFYFPAAVVQNLLSKKCVWDNRKKVKGRKKRMAQNWELKYNTGKNKDFRSLARYDFQSKLPKNWMIQSIMTRLWKWLPKVCYLRVLPNYAPNFSYK